jgi:hypothetical protein
MRLWPVLAILVSLAVARPAAAEDIIYAVPNGDYRLVLQRFEPGAIRGPDGKPITEPVMGLREALNLARPGVTIQLLPGTYTRDTPAEGILFPRDGLPDKPITLRGTGSGTVIDGRTELSKLVSMVLGTSEESALTVPDFLRGVNCVRLDGKQWIVIDNLTFLRCADAAVYVRNSQYVTLRNSTIIGGLYAFFATGVQSHHLLLEDNVWIQDPSEAMWKRIHWCEYKYGDLKAQAGALFASLDIPGGVIVRRNKVHNVFNGVRMDVSGTKRRKLPKHRVWIGKLNTNVEVYNNDFSFTRDNVLEPEFDATNWWFYGNRIRNAHAWFSFDGLWGGRWYVYDNVGWFDDKPGRECGDNGACKHWAEQHPTAPEQCTDLHDGGRVFKFRPDGLYAPGPLYIFNNSWYLRASLIKDGRLGYIGHWDNAIAFCRPEDYPDGLCEGSKPFFNGFLWDSDNYAFNHDLSNHPDFTAGLRAQGYRVSGISVPSSQPLFSDAAHGDFSLVKGSPGRGAGCIIDEDERGLLECRDPQAPATGPDIGAPEAAAPGPAVDFIFYDGGLYPEPPRIVRADLPRPESTATDAGTRLRIVFSTPIRLMASDLRANFDYGDAAPSLTSDACQYSGRTLTCPVTAVLPAAPLRRVLLPDAIVGPTGLLATTWGSVSDSIAIPNRYGHDGSDDPSP